MRIHCIAIAHYIAWYIKIFRGAFIQGKIDHLSWGKQNEATQKLYQHVKGGLGVCPPTGRFNLQLNSDCIINSQSVKRGSSKIDPQSTKI